MCTDSSVASCCRQKSGKNCAIETTLLSLISWAYFPPWPPRSHIRRRSAGVLLVGDLRVLRSRASGRAPPFDSSSSTPTSSPACGATRARRLPRRCRPRRYPRPVCTMSPPIAVAADRRRGRPRRRAPARARRPRTSSSARSALRRRRSPARPSSPPSCTKPAADRRRPPCALGHRGALVARVLSSPCDHQRPPRAHRSPVAAAVELAVDALLVELDDRRADIGRGAARARRGPRARRGLHHVAADRRRGQARRRRAPRRLSRVRLTPRVSAWHPTRRA